MAGYDKNIPDGLPVHLSQPEWDVVEDSGISTPLRRLVAIDVETTSLLPAPGSVVEVGWYDITAQVGGRFVPPHTLEGANPEALHIGGYYTRGVHQEVPNVAAVAGLHELLTDATLVGANPAFDAAQLSCLFSWQGLTPSNPWHHRLIDVSAAAYWLNSNAADGALPGLADACQFFDVPVDNHHSALDDALMAAKVWRVANSRRTR